VSEINYLKKFVLCSSDMIIDMYAKKIHLEPLINHLYIVREYYIAQHFCAMFHKNQLNHYVLEALFFVLSYLAKREENTKNRDRHISLVASSSSLVFPLLPTISPRGESRRIPDRAGSHSSRSPPFPGLPLAAGAMPRRGETAVVPIDVDGGQGRPKSQHHRSHGPEHHARDGPRHQHRSRPPPPPPPEFRPFRRWFPFLVPLFIVVNVVLFVLTMYVNDCPAHARATGDAIGGSVGESATAQGCWLAPELGRFAFQSFKENPLVGPSSAT
jgi:hypothetical protein